ncbi:hypothetical protein L3V82_05915 [Thiotrichales bacterium 19S3-7]|nr:hypothetical protein [Thiotrichales bacterium 19S3-7]MCF6801631.1 hypothetical protein [Thiotrichales bacterium 19S3-11]
MTEKPHKTMNKKTTYQAVLDLDLSYIIDQMCSSEYPLPQWQKKDATVCELLYKRFLWLLIQYPDTSLVPTKEIDEFWHNHILHTQCYVNDCYQLAGRYLHHHPLDLKNFDQQTLLNNFQQTQSLYLKEFSEPLKVFI